VDYGVRQRLLNELKGKVEQSGSDLVPLAGELLGSIADGRIKLYVIYRTLHFRREHEGFFRDGTYVPLAVAGERADHVCAFARGQGGKHVLVAVPRLVVRLTGGQATAPLGLERWQETRLVLPAEVADRRWRNLYTGEVVVAAEQEGAWVLPLASALRSFPVALLYPLGEGEGNGRPAADGQRG
jgi:(1->4)-alpha-D-glucan 1-alpha-D-glucosylmutase